MKALTDRASFKRSLCVAILLLPLAGCGGHWNMSWNESGCGNRSGGYHGGACGDGDALGSLVVLGVVGVAWGIHQVAEAMSGE